MEALEAQIKEQGDGSSKAKSSDGDTRSSTTLTSRPKNREEITAEIDSPTQSTTPGPNTGELPPESNNDYFYWPQESSPIPESFMNLQALPNEYDTSPTAGNTREDFLSDFGSSLSPELSLLDFFLAPPSPSHSPASTSQLVDHLLGNQVDERGDYTLAARLQDQQVSTFTFPDDRLLEVPSLTLLNAVLTVALRLNVADRLWDTSAMSPFYIGSGSPSPTAPAMDTPSSSSSYGMAELTRDLYSSELLPDLSGIPAHLRPTSTQRLIPHHPLLDLLPWPSTRDRLIQVFNVPPYLRPPVARDPLGMVRLVYDMEDPGGEGLSLSGQDPFDPRVWVIGQVMFDGWWWAFEANVINECNQFRRERGKDVLSLEWANRTFKSVGA